MEEQLFDYVDWDLIDTFIFQFIKVTRKSDGKKFDFATINYEKGTVEYQQKNGEFERFKLILTEERI
jgi:SET domain-containing protein